MAVSKIQDHQEVLRWFEEGRTYQWMVDRYLEKYNIETTISLWANYRRRHGLNRRIVWDDELIPWNIKLEHRYSYPALNLRKEARRRAGVELSPEDTHRVDTWIENMKQDGVVVHYDPETDEGWFYVKPRPGVDTDLIRVPERKARRSAG